MSLWGNEYVAPEQFPEAVKIRRSDENDSMWLAALHDLRDIIHPDELEKYSPELASNLTLSQRFAVWRGRRRNG